MSQEIQPSESIIDVEVALTEDLQLKAMNELLREMGFYSHQERGNVTNVLEG